MVIFLKGTAQTYLADHFRDLPTYEEKVTLLSRRYSNKEKQHRPLSESHTINLTVYINDSREESEVDVLQEVFKLAMEV